jgi:hypothetical protein
MFVGHFGLAFGAKRAAPSVSLAWLFVACELADLIWPVLVLAGIERVEVQPGITAMTPLNFVSYPYSHSLVTLCLWGVVLGGVYVALKKAGILAAATIAVLVVSHWVLDVVTHRPDMPLTPWSPTRVGLGLWNSIPATVVVELLIFGAGVALYRARGTPLPKARAIALWVLVGFMLAIYVANIVGPPPPSATAVAWAANALWLLVVWAYWVDRKKTVRS